AARRTWCCSPRASNDVGNRSFGPGPADATDRAFARLHTAAASVPRAIRHDPDAIADHVLRAVLPDGLDAAGSAEDVVLLAARFE
ncbi:hypothetical protein RMT89_06810, partial [Streptomyces sp. P17]|nr:hypothetical protein [Streptomyces sp. P17]